MSENKQKTWIRWHQQASKELPDRWEKSTPISEIFKRHAFFSATINNFRKSCSIEKYVHNVLM